MKILKGHDYRDFLTTLVMRILGCNCFQNYIDSGQRCKNGHGRHQSYLHKAYQQKLEMGFQA